MSVLELIEERREQGKRMHMTLIDPDKQTPEVAGSTAKRAEELGTDAIMVGGSTGVTQDNLDKTVLAIKDATHLPVIYFPGTARAISPYCDAIYFMSLLNSTDPKMLVGEQVKGAVVLKKMENVEKIGMGYIIVEPGMKVGEVGKAEPVPRDRPDKAVAYALAAQYFGMKLVYLEAGSGAPEPVPPEMITAVRTEIDIPLIIGGGIRTPEAAGIAAKAGADIVITGTIVEQAEDLNILADIIRAVKSD